MGKVIDRANEAEIWNCIVAGNAACRTPELCLIWSIIGTQ
jgi:hypothetical protein